MRKEIVPAFEKEHPKINVRLDVGLAKTWLANLRASGVDNPPYDVMMTNEIWAVFEHFLISSEKGMRRFNDDNGSYRYRTTR